MPEWIRHILKIRRRAGLESIPIPTPCLGLDEHEMEQDLSFFHTLREALADRKEDSTEASGEDQDGEKQQISPQDPKTIKTPPHALQV